MIHVPPGVAPEDVTIRVQCPRCRGALGRWVTEAGRPARTEETMEVFVPCTTCGGDGKLRQTPPTVRCTVCGGKGCTWCGEAGQVAA